MILIHSTTERLKNSIPIVFFIFVFQWASSQNDTIYYNAQWKPTVKDSASFFRPPIVKEGELFRVKDYFISGKLQMNAVSKSAKKDVWQGQVTWYNEDGSIFQQGEYSNGRLNGDFVTYFNGERLLANYQNGRFSSGRQNVNFRNGTQYYTEKRNDTLVDITHNGNLNGIRLERYSKDKQYDLVVKYYGEDGKYIGQRTKLSNGNYDGIEVFYYYNPFQVKTVNYFRAGRQFASSSYYPNGKPRALFKETPDLTKTFYDKNGNIIAEMTYLADQYGLKPYQGTLINFKYGEGEEAYLKSSKISYDAGKKIEDIIYHDNQKIKTKTTFKPAGQKHLQIGFDKTGNEVSRMEYRNYLPFNGKEILADRIAEYKEGKLVEELVYYSKTKDVFSIKTNEQEKYYDTDGELLGTLQLDFKENYAKPLNGTRYYQDYYGGISSFEEYKDGFVIKRTRFRDRKIGENDKKKTFKTIEVYQPETYNRIKEISHYSNGQVQAITTYKKYVELNGTYYDRQGNLLGNYDYENKDGIRYRFFADSDQIEEIEEMQEGKQIRYKKYTYGSNSSYGAIDPVLVEDVDINCCASYFTRDGQLIAKATFKDQKPWSGALYDPKTYEKYTLETGKRNGIYQKLDYNMIPLVEGKYVNDKREGIFKTFNRRGEVKSTENYKNDKLDGLSSYYSDKGKLIGKMEYKGGLPMNGVRTIAGSYGSPLTTETYEEGKLIEKIESWKEGNRVTTYRADNTSETIVYYPDSEIKRLRYSSKNRVIDGMVTRYDKEGNVQNEAQIKSGRLVSGTVYLTPPGGDGNMKYSKLTKGEETIELVFYGEKDKILFEAEEHLYFGSATYYLQNLNIRLDYLNERDLY